FPTRVRGDHIPPPPPPSRTEAKSTSRCPPHSVTRPPARSAPGTQRKYRRRREGKVASLVAWAALVQPSSLSTNPRRRVIFKPCRLSLAAIARGAFFPSPTARTLPGRAPIGRCHRSFRVPASSI